MRLALGLIAFGWLPGLAIAIEPPRLRELRTQQVGDVTYFHARFDRPANIWPADITSQNPAGLAQLTRLVPQDDRTRNVVTLHPAMSGLAERGLEFYGRRVGTENARFLMLLTTSETREGKAVQTKAELPIELDFAQAAVLPAKQAETHASVRRMDVDDLEAMWAWAQAQQFAVLEAQTTDFSYYAFARTAMQRTYGVRVDALTPAPEYTGHREHYRQLYETTTGASAVTRSLQLERMLGRVGKEGPREVEIAKVPGIDIAEHPWQKMMNGKTPDPEPLAKLVPHDNYYLHFKSFAKFIELGDFADQWGTNAVRAYEVQSRDYRIRERYEKQLCLKTSVLGRTLGPLVIKGMAVTGSDGYLREGSDLTIIFQVADAGLFRAGVEPYLAAARQEFGDRLKVGTEQFAGLKIESFTTPRREVSLWRTSFDDCVVYSNSQAGLRRVLDTRAGKIKPLADSLGFQYMRTVFKHSDPEEDGFAFFSDAFIRQLVGPASKIKEKRRLEGLTGVHMPTNAALWHNWDLGKPPKDLDTALLHAGLTGASLQTKDQTAVNWSASEPLATSDFCNTVHFATPLIEMSIDRVTKEEEREYRQFRDEYARLWREFFDPIGIRVRLNGHTIKLETYILPLIRDRQYAELRRETGGDTVPANASPPTAKTVAQLLGHIGPQSRLRSLLEQDIGMLGVPQRGNWLGDWAFVRFDDSPVYARLAAIREQNPRSTSYGDEIDLVFQMPATVGIEIRNPLVFAGVLTALRSGVMNAAPDIVTWEPLEKPYKDVQIVRIQATPNGRHLLTQGAGQKKTPLPAIYYAILDGGWYASLQEQPVYDMIDRHKSGTAKPAAGRQVNSTLYFSPAAAGATQQYVRGYIERESHKRALANLPIWYAFEKSGLLAGHDRESSWQNVLYQQLGFVPVSPEGAPYIFERRTDDVRNARHGTLGTPTPQTTIATDSPLGKLLDQLLTLNADLRFREDGIHTTVTVEKK